MNAAENRRLAPVHWAVRAALAAAACMMCALSACNTTEGMGKDLENLGDNIEDAARDAKD